MKLGPTEIYLGCECSDLAHMARFHYWTKDLCEEGAMYLSVHLSTYKGFLGRLWVAIKYVFGHKSNFGEFDEIIIQPKDYSKLIDMFVQAENEH